MAHAPGRQDCNDLDNWGSNTCKAFLRVENMEELLMDGGRGVGGEVLKCRCKNLVQLKDKTKCEGFRTIIREEIDQIGLYSIWPFRSSPAVLIVLPHTPSCCVSLGPFYLLEDCGYKTLQISATNLLLDCHPSAPQVEDIFCHITRPVGLCLWWSSLFLSVPERGIRGRAGTSAPLSEFRHVNLYLTINYYGNSFLL